MTKRGFTLALIGPDGAGKTTVARRLAEVLPLPVTYLYMGVSPESSNLLLPTTRLVHAIRRARDRKSLTAATSWGSIGRPTRLLPPEITAVSTDLTELIDAEGFSRVPTDVITSLPSTDAINTSYDAPNRFASANTSYSG